MTAFFPDTLHVALQPVRDEPAPEIFETGVANGACVRWPSWDDLIMCLPGTARGEWERIRPDFAYE